MKTLVIVESPAKCKTIQKYLGSNYVVKASFGHIRDLPNNEFGVDIENDFKPNYVLSPTKGNVIKELKEQAKNADAILLASDPDREGEAIAWHLHSILKPLCKNIKRIEFNEITQTSVLDAVSKPHEINYSLVDSQQARRILDRLVGYQVSPWLSKSLGSSKLSAGRVQSVALRIVKDREDEIKNFKPEEFWKIYADLQSDDNIPFTAELFKKNEDKIVIPNKSIADGILEDLNGATYSVCDIIKKDKKKSPSAPFTTSKLQQEGSKKLNWDSSTTMKVAQELYEGVTLEDGSPHGLITYMRTDSTRINPDIQAQTLDYIANTWGPQYKPSTPNIYKTKGDAQDAHEAIRPTDVTRTPDSVANYLSGTQLSLYRLIWERYVASQMSAAILDTVSVIVKANDYYFKSSGYSVQFDGFMVLYTEIDEDNKEDDGKDKKLPVLTKDQILDLVALKPIQKFTTPPSRYTEASLIDRLEKLGVGRPSTYANIIATIKNRSYVTVSSKKFQTTKLGEDVVNILVAYFTDIMEVKFTASMEENLDEISVGKLNWVSVLKDFYTPFEQALIKAKKEVQPKSPELQLTDIDCPLCGKKLAIKKVGTSEFLGCSGYPECKVTLQNDPNYYSPKATCDKCGKGMFLKEIKKDGKKEYFLGCIGYPECKNSKACDKNGKEKVVKKDKEVCEKCGSDMILREGKSGKFWGCSGYPNCNNIRPYGKTKECPNCKKPMTLRKGTNGNFWGCTGYPNCKQTLPDGDLKKCPKCDKPMAKRKGANGDFWGCTGYPDCKHTEKA